MRCAWMDSVGLPSEEQEKVIMPARTVEELSNDPLVLEVIAAEMALTSSYELPSFVSEEARARAEQKEYLGNFYKVDLIKLIERKSLIPEKFSTVRSPSLAENLLGYFRDTALQSGLGSAFNGEQASAALEKIHLQRLASAPACNDGEVQLAASQTGNNLQQGDNNVSGLQPS